MLKINNMEINLDDIVVITVFDNEFKIIDKNAQLVRAKSELDINKLMQYLKSRDYNNFVRLNNRIINLDYLKSSMMVDNTKTYNNFSIFISFNIPVNNKKRSCFIMNFNTLDEMKSMYSYFTNKISEYDTKLAESVIG